MRRATHAGVWKQKCETTKSRTANDAHAPTNARQRSRNGNSHAKTIALSSQRVRRECNVYAKKAHENEISLPACSTQLHDDPLSTSM